MDARDDSRASGRPPWCGVNLGGWLVLERWMAPSLFEKVAPTAHDERSFMERGGMQAAEAVTRFRDSFITLQDFQWLARIGGVNCVRLPVGFWCLEEHAEKTPYLPTCSYVDSVFDWAEECGLMVLLELHGAAGSQNGQHHSGQAGQVRWMEEKFQALNLQVLKSWAKRWGQRKALLGLGLGNEVDKPVASFKSRLVAIAKLSFWQTCVAPVDYWDQVAAFYTQASRLCRPHLREDVVLVIDTCWDMDRWRGRLANIEGPIWIDYHHYQCFSDDGDHIHDHIKAEALAEVVEDPPFPLVLGEFSLALRKEVDGHDTDGWQLQFFRSQTGLAQHSEAWFFWSYKLAREDWHHWSYRSCMGKSWVDVPLSVDVSATAGDETEL